MPEVALNWGAIVVAALFNMVLGMVWYSKGLFGTEWAKLTGRKIEEMSGGSTGYVVAAVGSLLQAYVLSHFVAYAGSSTFAEGLTTGFWLWVGFVAVVTATHLVFEGRSWSLWKINAGYFLVILLVNGGLLAAWR